MVVSCFVFMVYMLKILYIREVRRYNEASFK